MPSISEYCTIIKDDITNDNVKFAPFFFSVLGLSEEVFEMEESFVENFESKTELLAEAGDVIFYCFQLINRLGLTEEFVNQYKIEDFKNNVRTPSGLILNVRSASINTNFYQMRKFAGKITGMTKKLIRVNQEISGKELKLYGAYTSEILLCVFKILNLNGLSIEVCLNKNLEKRKTRLKEYQEKIKENTSKTKVASSKKKTKMIPPEGGMDISNKNNIFPKEDDFIIG